MDDDTDIRRAAARALSARYPDDPVCVSFVDSGDAEIKRCAVDAFSMRPNRDNVLRLIGMLSDKEMAPHVVVALSRICEQSHEMLEFIMHRYRDPDFSEMRDGLTEILSNRAEYFILKLNTSSSSSARRIIGDMLDSGFVNTIFGFLARNRDVELENAVLDIIRERSSVNPDTARLSCEFLDERMLRKIGMKATPHAPLESSARKNFIRRRELVALPVCLVALFVLIFSVRYHAVILSMGFYNVAAAFVIDGVGYLIAYSMTVNSIYLMLLLLSAFGAMRQDMYSRVKKKTFMFRRSILPGISVIGPAYNEEANIIESVNSLLNLRYPDFEVIIVNDGSRDQTLNRLIRYFGLEKVDLKLRGDIITRPVRGVYRSSSIPKLTVVDKLNGGKADSLNAGINISGKEYFCGIDADSLLSESALLGIIGSSLDVERETVAMGGNIFPINGCVVNRGVIESIGLPANVLAGFQFAEYIRAFMAGRIGWAFIDAMLIISGAFGLFERRRVVECGGYLTSSGKYGLDTVGEDMELVVRLTRHMHERKIPCKIGYAYNANCWTEVPQRLGALLRQRDRWHRGLMEIFSFHREMFGNFRYGRVGTVALPYFLLFEIIGPWIEAFGYLMVVVAALLGLLNIQITVWLFIATVMFGVFISVASIIIAEQEVNYFTMRDVFGLVMYAVMENFGFRQLMSLWRVAGYINAIRGNSEWGVIARRGFAGRDILPPVNG